MHSSGSFLLTVIERIRYYVDEAVLDAKYNNDFIVRHVIMPEMVNVWSRLSRNYDNPVLVTLPITLASNQRYYQLPPNVGEIWRVTRDDGVSQLASTQNRVRRGDLVPRSQYSTRGPNWSIQGNLLTFESTSPIPAGDYLVWYAPSGDFLPHYSTTGEITDTPETARGFTLGTTISLGQIDTRPEAYTGGMLRILPTSGCWEERVIESYDCAAGTLEVRVPFEHNAAATDVPYEIVPPGMQPLWQSVAASGALNLAAAKSVSQKQYQFFVTEYRKNIKSIGDWLANMQARRFKSYQKSTVDNKESTVYVLR